MHVLVKIYMGIQVVYFTLQNIIIMIILIYMVQTYFLPISVSSMHDNSKRHSKWLDYYPTTQDFT